jgi:hypothetical protein
VVFVPQLGKNSQFTDPSYHMPHFYELWARWADKDNEFWAEAVTGQPRVSSQTAVHPQTGLAPNYSYFDGKPYDDDYNGNFRYDAFRVGANVGVDHMWFHPSEWHVEQSNRLLDFFASQGIDEYKAEYTLDGEPEVAHRSPGLIATNAVAALAADPGKGKPFVQALWDQELPTGQYRYYDGLLMLLGLLQLSGNFQIYEPGSAPAGQVFPTPSPEVNGKFAPTAGHALLLIGQNAKSVDAYFDVTVTAPGGVAGNTSLQLNGVDELGYLADKYPKSILSVGVEWKGVIEDIAAGRSDAKIDALLDVLDSYNRPVFVRLGVGFDDPANKYVPGVYVSAWKKFHERMQAKAGTNVALVWQPASLCSESSGDYPLAEWYPGDEYVDWVGVSKECFMSATSTSEKISYLDTSLPFAERAKDLVGRLDVGRKSGIDESPGAGCAASEHPCLQLLERGTARRGPQRTRHGFPAGNWHGRHLGQGIDPSGRNCHQR